jgi:hypothetical protein
MDNETAFPLDSGGLSAAFERCALGVQALAELLSDRWGCWLSSDDRRRSRTVEVEQGKLTYLFDIAYARVVGVYGSSAPPSGEYPSTRMRGFPLPRTKRLLVRGHLAAHTVGGGTDINLVPQDAELNVSGAWRRLERWAQSRPGAFLAVEVSYDDDSQTPLGSSTSWLQSGNCAMSVSIIPAASSMFLLRLIVRVGIA